MSQDQRKEVRGDVCILNVCVYKTVSKNEVSRKKWFTLVFFLSLRQRNNDYSNLGMCYMFYDCLCFCQGFPFEIPKKEKNSNKGQKFPNNRNFPMKGNFQ